MRPKPTRRGLAPTLSDVAKAAGVSPMTVSRVINQGGSVRQATRDRVNAAIGALNYAPNAAARVLAGASQTRIALLYGNPSAAYLAEVLVGSLSEASRSDVQLMLEQCGAGESAADIVGRIADGQVDGVILPPPFCDSPRILAALRAAGVPTAVIATGAPNEDSFAVTIDDARAALEMTNHLLDLGHRRIGFIIGNPNQTASAKRLEGYKLALKQAGLSVESSLIAQGDFTYLSGLRAAERLLEARPTAIFASNDDMAAGALAAAHRRHLEVPHDLSICGFDDTALATTISPALTTVRQPVAEMAQAAVEMLAAAIRRQRAGYGGGGERKLFRHQIVRRQSDAAPPPPA